MTERLKEMHEHMREMLKHLRESVMGNGSNRLARPKEYSMLLNRKTLIIAFLVGFCGNLILSLSGREAVSETEEVLSSIQVKKEDSGRAKAVKAAPVKAVAAKAVKPVEKQTQAAPVRKTSYVVNRGDTLKSIAKHFYGKEDQWPRILRVNGLKSPLIQPGQKLQIQ